MKQRKKRVQKYGRPSEPDFSQWTDDQQRRYASARNALEREDIIAEVKRR